MTFPSSEELADLEELARLLGSQDNRITADPIFMVQERQRTCGIDPVWGGEVVWLYDDAEYTRESAPEEFAKLEAEYAETGEEKEDWTRTGYVERWEHIQPFLTESAANSYIKRNAHRYGRPLRVYVESAYRNPEWQLIRSVLGGSLLAAASLGLKAREVLREHGAACVGACEWLSNPWARAAVPHLKALLAEVMKDG